jgi:hypothetical protein
VWTGVFGLRKAGRTPGATIVRCVLRVTEADGMQFEIVTDDEMRRCSYDSFVASVCGGAFELCGVFDRRYDLTEPVTDASQARDIVAVFVRH